MIINFKEMQWIWEDKRKFSIANPSCSAKNLQAIWYNVRKNKHNEMKEKELGRTVDQYSTQHLCVGEGKVIKLDQSHEKFGKCSKGQIG